MTGSCRSPDCFDLPHLVRVTVDSAEAAKTLRTSEIISLGGLSRHTPFGSLSNGRNGGTRTHGPLLPKQVRYQAALHSGDGAG